jgi:hypothetical protein
MKPRKVRVFRDVKKSPAWYVEWRDAAGVRHCSSCGPRRSDAVAVATRIKIELAAARTDAIVAAIVADAKGDKRRQPPATTTNRS